MIEKNINPDLVPISKIKSFIQETSFSFIREQFPFVPAEALTIHKSQGKTYKQVCIDFNSMNRNVTTSIVDWSLYKWGF